MGPVDLALVERGAAALQLRLELAVHGEAVGHLEQLLVERVEHVVRQRRARLGARAAVELVLGGVVARHRLAELLVRLAQRGLRVLQERLRVLGGHDALGCKPVRVQLPHGRVVLDDFVHRRLRVRGLVLLVVAEAPVADEVDDHVAPELLAEGHREAHR